MERPPDATSGEFCRRQEDTAGLLARTSLSQTGDASRPPERRAAAPILGTKEAKEFPCFIGFTIIQLDIWERSSPWSFSHSPGLVCWLFVLSSGPGSTR